jgi:hypothetical protein
MYEDFKPGFNVNLSKITCFSSNCSPELKPSSDQQSSIIRSQGIFLLHLFHYP